MSTLRQAAQAVINEWEEHAWATDGQMEYLRTALAAPEQEPVAYFNMAVNETVGCIAYEYAKHGLKSGEPLYASPVDIAVLQAKCDAFFANVILLDAEVEELTKERDALIKTNADYVVLLKQSLQGGADICLALSSPSSIKTALTPLMQQ